MFNDTELSNGFMQQLKETGVTCPPANALVTHHDIDDSTYALD
jgi:hypothetical protein